MAIFETEHDEQNARARSQAVPYTGKSYFKTLLRRDFELYLKQNNKPCCRISTFVEHFNAVNVARKCKPLDTKGLSYTDYFRANPDVCRVDPTTFDLYPVSPNRMSRSSQQSSRAGRFPSAPPVSRGAPSTNFKKSTSPEFSTESSRRTASLSRKKVTFKDQQSLPATNGADAPRNLTISGIQQLLVNFTHSHSGEKLDLQDYFDKLKDHDCVLHDRFIELESEEFGRIKFLTDNVSGPKNKITIDGSKVISISVCSCCESCLQSPSTDPRLCVLGNDGETFSKTRESFPRVELPLKEWLKVELVDCDSCRGQLHLNFIYKNSLFLELHEELRADYKNNVTTVEDIDEGMLCSVPWEGTKDYHRAVVADVSDPTLPVVFYVDRGVSRAVARGCIRHLFEKYQKIPIFYLSGKVAESPRWPERNRLKEKLQIRGEVSLCADKYDEKTKSYILSLDTDSGVESDASRD